MYEEIARFQDNHWYFIGMREILLGLFGEMPSGPARKILDVGCGTGQFTPALSRWGRVVGVDLSSQAFRLHPGNADQELILVRGDAQRLPFQQHSFDLVWASSILEHLKDDRLALQEIQRVLKPGGRVVINVPAHHFLWGHNDEIAHHLRRYTRDEITALCRACGLKILRMTNYGAAPLPLTFLVRKIKNGLSVVFPKLKEITDFRLAAFPGLGFFFLSVLRQEKRALNRFDLPFGLMLYVLAEKENSGAEK